MPTRPPIAPPADDADRALPAGLLLLEASRLEALADTVIALAARNPLAPLETELVLVGSQGMAEWLKMRCARQQGVCSALRAELPGIFVWQMYRQVLAAAASNGAELPAEGSALDKGPLAWRLMRLLRVLADDGLQDGVQDDPGGATAGRAAATDDASDAMTPVRQYLRPRKPLAADADPDADDPDALDALLRRFQLARRVADLFDQYQVYRPDWLEDWAHDRDVLAHAAPAPDGVRTFGGSRPGTGPMPEHQRWQAVLWRALLSELEGPERERLRPQVHARVLRILAQATRTGLARGTLDGGPHGQRARLPRRIVAFGATHLPPAELALLQALAPFVQVVVAVPNPCRFDWSQLVDGRAQLRQLAKIRPSRDSTVDYAALADDALVGHGHPLLAAWARQARDHLHAVDAMEEDLQRGGVRPLRLDPSVAPPGEGVEDEHDLGDDHDHDRDVEERDADGRDADGRDADGRDDDKRDADERRASGGTCAPALGDRAGGATPRPDPDAPPTWLAQLHVAIRDLVPLAEHPARTDAPADGLSPLAAADDSIRFYVAHGPQREVEILHDHLLDLFAQPPTKDVPALAPRDVVVMVPDIATFAPAIRAVFGGVDPDDARHVPWGITDLRGDDRHPIVAALRTLMRAPHHRLAAGAIAALLEVPAIARRFGLDETSARDVVRWAQRAGARWGLDAAHRERVGLGAAGAANTWDFALERLLLGHATGAHAHGAFDGVQPDADVGGLETVHVGALAEFLAVLRRWWDTAGRAHPPAAWAHALQALLGDLVAARDDDERALVLALEDALVRWQRDCEQAVFDEPVPLAVAEIAWLDGIGGAGASARFRAGGVTFCTLLPLRAIPFEVVCLLGMDDGAFPRPVVRDALDLMALPGHARIGDRARRDDDRQLMLDAVLSARRQLVVSWSGRHPRDNEPLAPSVLVGQLRDYLAAGWGADALAARTVEHPLHPHARRYFEVDAEGSPREPTTWAHEWRAMHAAGDAVRPPATVVVGASDDASDASNAGAHAAPDSHPIRTLRLRDLAALLKHPVRTFVHERLRVRLDEPDADLLDDEPFALGGLDGWSVVDAMIGTVARTLDRSLPDGAPPASAQRIEAVARSCVQAAQREGGWPIGAPGFGDVRTQLQVLVAIEHRRQQWRAGHPLALPPRTLRLAVPGLPMLVEDVVTGLRAESAGAAPQWFDCTASRITDRKSKSSEPIVRPDKLVMPWLRRLAVAAAQAGDHDIGGAGLLVGVDAIATFDAIEADAARDVLTGLARHWWSAAGPEATRPWPTALRTAFAWLSARASTDDDAPSIVQASHAARLAFDGTKPGAGEIGRDAELQRLYESFDALCADGRFAAVSRALYERLHDDIGSTIRVEPLEGADVTDSGEPAA